MAGVGLETRTSILPEINIGTGPGITGPDYSFVDGIKFPDEVGVRTGNNLSDVIDSVKAVGYYTDMIGFGESSSFLSRGLGVRPLGVNFWQRTGFTCSNGADMWQYIESIPKGDALGQRVDQGLRRSGLPRLRGLAPGIVEDAKDALDPRPLMQAVFSGGSPQCRWDVRPVGDTTGSIRNPTSGKFYIENPETVYQQGGQTVQGRWVFDKTLTREAWNNALKTHCPDGYPKKNHQNGSCDAPILNRSIEAFTDKQRNISTGILLGVAVIGSLFVLKLANGR